MLAAYAAEREHQMLAAHAKHGSAQQMLRRAHRNECAQRA